MLGIVAMVFVVVAVGTVEDCSRSVTPQWRLLLTAIAAIVAIYWLGLTVPRLDLGLSVDQWWIQWPVLGLTLAFLGLIGLTHAFNLIDGYNGLAGTVAVLYCTAYILTVQFKLPRWM